MKKLSPSEQKLLDFIGTHPQGISLEEIKHWAALDFTRGYVVSAFCRDLVREGLLTTTIVADGVTMYSAAK